MIENTAGNQVMKPVGDEDRHDGSFEVEQSKHAFAVLAKGGSVTDVGNRFD